MDLEQKLNDIIAGILKAEECHDKEAHDDIIFNRVIPALQDLNQPSDLWTKEYDFLEDVKQ